jgi:trimethylamine:corrinoid methyltransferase-like protein
LCRIGQAAGRAPPYCCLEIPISPLRLNHTSLDIIYRNRDHRYNLKGICLGGGAIPLVGATAPIFFPGMLVQGMAEALAAYITPKLIEPEVYGYCSFGGFLFDMRTMQPATPFPESVLFALAGRQVIRHILGETFGVSFAFNPEDPADVFRIAFMAGFGICSGSSSFINVGADRDGFNPVRAVIQADILRHCERFARGLPYREEKGLSSKVIQEALSTGMLSNYLDHPTTLEFREFYLEPELFFKYSGEELKAKARAVARQKTAEHAFRLPNDKREALAQIYREADSILRSH